MAMAGGEGGAIAGEEVDIACEGYRRFLCSVMQVEMEVGQLVLCVGVSTRAS